MKHVLLIPTHNRAAFLKRTFAFLGGQPERFPEIYVVDSSDPAAAAENRRLCDASALPVQYRWHDPKIGLFEKIARGVEATGAALITVLADDDFALTRGSLECAQFLEHHPQYSAATGRCLVVTRRESDHVAYTPYPQRALESRFASVRLRDHLLRYCPTFYATHRAPLLLRCMRTAATHTREFKLGELLPSCLTVISGRLGCIGDLSLVREDNPVSTQRNSQSWSEFLKKPELEELVTPVVRAVAEPLKAELGVGAEAFVRHYLGLQMEFRDGRAGIRKRLAETRRPSLRGSLEATPLLWTTTGPLRHRAATAWRWARADVSPSMLQHPRLEHITQLMLTAATS